jgi:hypothetical protein
MKFRVTVTIDGIQQVAIFDVQRIKEDATQPASQEKVVDDISVDKKAD